MFRLPLILVSEFSCFLPGIRISNRQALSQGTIAAEPRSWQCWNPAACQSLWRYVKMLSSSSIIAPAEENPFNKHHLRCNIVDHGEPVMVQVSSVLFGWISASLDDPFSNWAVPNISFKLPYKRDVSHFGTTTLWIQLPHVSCLNINEMPGEVLTLFDVSIKYQGLPMLEDMLSISFALLQTSPLA